MTNQDNIRELSRIVGRENVLFSQRDLVAYSYDATQHQVSPGMVVFCQNTAEVSAVVKLAQRKQIAVVPRGAGTGISGGTIPLKDSLVLELSRMNKILSIDLANRRAVVEPGVVNLELQEALAPLGFLYPPDPASQKVCTLGGNVGENAGGPLCFRYGVTSKYVCGLEVVLPSGEIVTFGGQVEDSPGYDLRGLFIGSEGTLGIATRLILQILPVWEAQKTMLAIFDRLEDAGRAVADIIQAGIIPCTLELMDKKMCGAIEESLKAGYPTDAEGVLLIEVAGLADGLDRQARDITEICQRNKVRQVRFAKNGSEREILWKGRKGAFGSVARICPPYLVNDGTVPRNRIVEALMRVQELPKRYPIQIANVAHAGDGNLHPLIVYDRNNPEEVLAAKKAGEEVLAICLDLGGTISGEHGIGLEKLWAMSRMFSPADLAAMRKVKQVFDPENILNPGKLLPPEKEAGKELPASQGKVQTLVEKMAAIVGPANLVTGIGPDSAWAVDGQLPEMAIFPSNNAQLSQIVKAASQSGKSLIPLGSNSKKQIGPPVSAAEIVLSLKKMNQIVDLDPGNASVAVQAGRAISELQKDLAKHKLFLPLDPYYGSSTIGGALAADESGPRRFGYGTARDLVLGLTVVIPGGDILRAGGKTMKNVAGLDMAKLFVGSWGTLGIISEATLRLYPLPEVSQTACLTFASAGGAMELAGRILNSPLTPAALEMADWSAANGLKCSSLAALKKDEYLVLINLEGNSEIVERQLRDIFALAGAAKGKAALQNPEAAEIWEAYRRANQSLREDIREGILGKASVPLSQQAGMVEAIKRIGQDNGVETTVTAHCGNGIIYARIKGANDAALNSARDLKSAAYKCDGFFAIEGAPLQIRKDREVWIRPEAYNLMKRLKQAFDPENGLNPGRLLD